MATEVCFTLEWDSAIRIAATLLDKAGRIAVATGDAGQQCQP